MGKRLKPDHLRMDTDLRIPVTAEQKALIVEATSDEPEGMAAWARAVLMEAARKKSGAPGRSRAKSRGAGPNTN